MGAFADYFRPVSAGYDLEEVLTSNTKHSWSSSVAGTFVAPAYASQALGGSSFLWPQAGRSSLPFWGSNGFFGGGCCQAAQDSPAAWGQSFSLNVLATPVPEPEGYTLALAAAGMLAAVLRRRRIANATTPMPARAKP